MKKILFPTAYSMQSKVAFRYTQKLAQFFDASITLLHVYEHNPQVIGFSPDLDMEVENEKYHELEDFSWKAQLVKLKGFAKEMEAKQFKKIPIDYIATDGVVIDEIMEVHKANNFDLIVMGMRQHSLPQRLFGNTTYTIIDKVTCPLLLVPPTAHYLGLDKIIYGTAFQVGDEAAIDHLFEWCQAFDSKLHLLHVYQKEDKELAHEKLQNLTQEYLKEQEAGIMTFQLLEGKIQEALQNYIKFNGADMLAVHRRKRGFWQRIQEGSLTKKMTEDSQIPLLIL